MIPRPADPRRARVARAGGAAAIATLTASAAHTLGGGTPPAPWLVLTVALLAWPVALAIDLPSEVLPTPGGPAKAGHYERLTAWA